MTCEDVRQLLHGYVDDELDLATALKIEQHLPGCPQCQNELEAAKAISVAAAQTAVYFRAPESLRERVRQAIRAESGQGGRPRASDDSSWWNRPWAYSGLAAGLLLVIGSALLFLPPPGGHGPVDELVGSHVRSLEANHLMDVESTDQHTVKPWFAGKIDFSPPVIDLASEGFPLVGGRLDYLDQRKVAALVYHCNKHIINLFIWPGEVSPETDSKQGFNLIRFECKGMVCWAVSDLNTTELQQFVDLFKAQKPASTRF